MIVLDTHTLLWMDRDDPMLGPISRHLIEDAWRSGDVCVSAISFWETGMLVQRKRVVLPVSATEWRAELLKAGIVEIALDGRLGLLATQLETLHRDPADRFIMATALHHSATLLTADCKILEWQSDLSRQDARA